MIKKAVLGLVFFGSIFSLVWAEEIRYDSGNRRDPFQPLVGPGALTAALGPASGGIEIEGIVYDPKGGSYAVISGEIYREGESLNGIKLVQILSDRVVFLQEGEEVVIWLREEILQESRREGGA